MKKLFWVLITIVIVLTLIIAVLGLINLWRLKKINQTNIQALNEQVMLNQ